MRRPIQWARRRAFLQELARSGNVRGAARAAGNLNVSALYKARRGNPAFAAAWDQAREIAREVARDLLLGEAIRRGYDGWLEPVFYKGAKCGEVRRYANQLAIAALEILKPEKYAPLRGAQPAGPPKSRAELVAEGARLLTAEIEAQRTDDGRQTREDE